MRHRPVLAISSTIALAVSLALCCGSRHDENPPFDKYVESVSLHPAPMGNTSLSGAFAEAIELASDQLVRQRQLLGPRMAPPTLQSSAAISDDVAWPGDYRRTHFPLFEHFTVAMGSIDAKQLVRHDKLNPRDLRIDPRLVAELEGIVGDCNLALTAIAEAYDTIHREEMVSQIEAGMVPEDVDTVLPNATLRAMARARLKEGQYPGMSLDDVVEVLRKRGLKSIRANSIVHQGKAYRMDSFSSLPQSDAALDALKFLAFDTLGTVGSWFMVRGYLSNAELAALLEEVDQVTRHRLSHQGPAYTDGRR